MKRKCDQCGRPATHHAVDIVKGVKTETHLCDVHAAEAGLDQTPAAHTPIDELLTSFVKVHSTGETATIGKAPTRVCSSCGLTFSEFREKSLLGCPTCYADFEAQLGPLLERAHEGGTHHVGKTPRRAGGAEQRQLRLARLQRRLDEALEAEDYESAAEIRDELEGVASASDSTGSSGATGPKPQAASDPSSGSGE
ncbi:UvrB/UvrC motif-containing protein [Phycisphaera mikurensis]|uniref:UVR domain-containing protein n=1 Tax=Phycisphaera mikurensis (strain NBRC 102666 / KCTC 22515 / FYK2301M01) TaxID=1142394 RepID=I0IHN6_PHYMF|nr:UvrB/UvrC motif-containing protein [Phycisphaera mikurensis]MBB6441019.1 protein arginine kinase activator [Phycisphaera mikurensis]BAM04774.1 hypothetical protein PSMK_26150 [Phycisphaera mikurensis NBRC 102666]